MIAGRRTWPSVICNGVPSRVLTFGASTGFVTSDTKFARLKAAQKVTTRDLEDLPDVRTLSIYDFPAVDEKIDRDRIFLAEGKVYRAADDGGDWARRAEISILQP